MSSKASLADYGVVGLVGGGIATLVLGILTLGMSAFLGRIPLTLGVLLALAAAVTAVSLLVTLATRNPGDGTAS